MTSRLPAADRPPRRRRSLSLAIGAACVVAVAAGLAPPASAAEPMVRLVVQGLSPAANGVAGARAVPNGELAKIGYQVVEVPQSQVASATSVIERKPGIGEVVPDGRIHATRSVNDPYDGKPAWPAVNTGLPAAWAVTTGSAAVTIGVIDSGTIETADLTGRVLPQHNIVFPIGTSNDDFGHGTQVAEVAAGSGTDGLGGAGACWQCRIQPIKVLDSSGNGYLSDAATALIWAADNNVSVANLSLGGYDDDTYLDSAIDYATELGTLVAAAAGNDGNGTPNWPAYESNAIAVAGTDSTNHLYGFSNRDASWVDLAAPGCDSTYTPWTSPTTSSFCGTSAATPVVSGIAALRRSLHPSEPAAVTRAALESTTTVGVTGVAHGLVSAIDALNYVAPVPPSGAFTGITPTRVLDTRTANVPSWWTPNTPLGPADRLDLQLADGNTPVVPADATAVVMNVTATNATATSYVTAWPFGQIRPNASNLNLTPGITMPNLATVKIGSLGAISLFNAGGHADLIVDVVGYYRPSAGDGYAPVVPFRALDTRGQSAPLPAGWSSARPMTAGESVALQVTGAGTGTIPDDATAVVMNVTAADASTTSWVTAYPDGQAVPTSSNLNLTPGLVTPNLVTIELGAGGRVELQNALGHTNLIADIVGYFSPSATGRFVPTDPTRIYDTRVGPTQGRPIGPLVGGTTLAVTVADGALVPTAATGVVANVTVTNVTANSWLSAWPAGQARPDPVSNLNLTRGFTVPNLVSVKVGTNQQVAFYDLQGTTALIVDVVGYYV